MQALKTNRGSFSLENTSANRDIVQCAAKPAIDLVTYSITLHEENIEILAKETCFYFSC